MRYVLAGFVALLSGCSEIGPYINFEEQQTVEDTVAIDEGQSRIVILEFFTGASCPNCPKGRKIADDLLQTYAGKLQVVEIHQGPLAGPALPGDPDLRTEEGEELAAYLGPPSYWPVGAINRVKHEVSPGNWQLLVDRSLWPSLVAEQSGRPLQVAMGCSLTYEPTARKLSGTLGVRFLESVDIPVYLTVLIIEDSIVSAQLDGVQLISDYVHRDVLRDFITPHTGVAIGSNKQKGETWYWSFRDYVIPDEWDDRHCHLVAMVTASGNSYEVFQSLRQKIRS
ncbi:MAG: Omp28-related outer membrane protein [Chitinophagales bacterium]|nr:Omp28-related outer membrane protein [Chitinophagales bacterium]MDW8427940.1 Omp28-related outer membrane protein [Chitinophagales bacterium]